MQARRSLILRCAIIPRECSYGIFTLHGDDILGTITTSSAVSEDTSHLLCKRLKIIADAAF